MKRISRAIAGFIVRHPWWFVIIGIAFSAAAVPGITMLETDTGFNALVSPASPLARDTVRYQAQFGGEPITVLLSGPLEDIFSPENLDLLAGLENRISADERYVAVDGPVSLLEAAVQAAAVQGVPPGIGEPTLDNPAFIHAVLYDADGNISAAFRPLVPDASHALIIITPAGNMSDNDALKATLDVQSLFEENPSTNVEVTVLSSAELVNAIATGIGNNIKLLLGLCVAAMIIILMFMFRVRRRLLSLVMVGLGALWTFGLMGYLSVPMTMTTMAVLPILIGLGIDFSIQFHNRYQEEIARSADVAGAIATSISRMLFVVGVALLATIIGFITLYISEVPMIREFGVMLAVGIMLSYIAAVFLFHGIILLLERNKPLERLRATAEKASGRIERVLAGMGRLAIHHTAWIFVVAVVFAVAGGVIDHRLPVNTDYEELMPQNIPELVDIRDLRAITGIGGTLRFLVEGDDLAAPGALEWMLDYSENALTLHGELISVNSPAQLVASAAGGIIPDRAQTDAILAATPQVYVARVISGDLRMASLTFSYRYLPLEEVHTLLQELRAEAEPPSGITLAPVGGTALGVSMVDAVIGSRATMNLVCLGAVFVILLAVYRRIGGTIFTILPVGAVIAWSSLDMYLIGIPLNPLTAIMGVLIIGICTEFMVMLLGRYNEEKLAGASPENAMTTAISKIGRAIVATALTTLGGFGVLIASDFVMIRDFGIATVISVFLCLVIALTVMPGLIVWYENRRSRRAAL